MEIVTVLLAGLLAVPVTPPAKGSPKVRSAKSTRTRATVTPQAVLLRGRLLDESGAPLSGRTIHLLDFESGERPVIMPTGERAIESSQTVRCTKIEGKWIHPQGTTDAEGRFSVPLDEFYDRHSMEMYAAVPKVPTGALGYFDEKGSCVGFRKPDGSLVLASILGLQPKDLGDVIVRTIAAAAATPTPKP